jgi:hypothetical protein
MQSVTLLALGLPAKAWNLVRVGWQQQGEPAWKISEDVCIIRCVEKDDEYNRIRDINTVEFNNSLTPLTQYTRVWDTFYTFYGPNSFDHARQVRSALYTQTGNDLLVAANLYCVMDISAPRRVVEFYANQWWERVDFEASFNEAVQETITDPTVESVAISLYDAQLNPSAPVAVITVEE